MKQLSEKEALKSDKDVIVWLEDVLTSEDPSSCKITIVNRDIDKKYEIPKGAYLRDYPGAVREAMNIIIRYKRTFGKQETQAQLENAPNLYSELIIAGKGKVLEYLLRNNNAA